VTDPSLCPYCSTETSNTDDHVFPEFLGGRATIRAGKNCNDTFGHTIEAKALTLVSKWFFLLRLYGIGTPKPTVWRNVEILGDGRLYDIDSDLNASLSRPEVARDERGLVTKMHGAPRHVTKAVKSFKADRRGMSIEKGMERFKVADLSLTFPSDDDLRRLCVKMSVACLEKSSAKYSLDPSVWEYLLTGTVSAVSPVRITFEPYVGLDELRPPVGHAIYLRSIASERRLFSIVQLFGGLQFYCELAAATDLPDYAYLSTHSSVGHEEQFSAIAPLDYSVPPQFLSPDEKTAGLALQLDKFGRELELASGRPPPSSTGDFGQLPNRPRIAVRKALLEGEK
jgi:hypothetical protein